MKSTVSYAFFCLLLASSHAWTVQTTFNSRSVRQPTNKKERRRRQAATGLNLFYMPPPIAASATTRFFVPESIANDWSNGVVDFPYTFLVNAGKKPTFTTSRPAPNATLTIRLMQWKDLEAITEMCIQEYSTYAAPEFSASPWAKFGDWLDQASLGPYVTLSMVLKLVLDYSTPKIPNDHAVLVASLAEPGKTGNKERLVGMVEVSRQPPIPDRNPPAIPVPLWLKEFYSRTFRKQPTEAWITNLLIVPEYRGRGWAKALVMACEGLARCWRTAAINLHCDASYRVPQKLYRSLGYRPESTSSTSSDYSWMSNNDVCQSSIYVIEGVPLLFMCKKL